MGILEGDIRLLASQVMADVPEGGGAATGTVIVDGASNNVFPDLSELDHTIGRVSLRKLFVGVNTPDTDSYLGANMIVADPPDNPDVSVVLFQTGDAFDERAAAAARLESYLARGTAYSGLLFGNHITGQQTVTLIQRTSAPLPVSGDTLVLVKFPGTGSEAEQFVRITDVASTTRDFTTVVGGGEVTFTRLIVTLTISEALLMDFPGFDAIYEDASVNYATKTQTFDTIVADAARYYSVVPLTEAANLGDFVVSGDGITAQLVPSSRTEVAITDARMDASTTAVAGTGVLASTNINAAFNASQPLYVGGGVLPGTLTVNVGGATLSDAGGALVTATGTKVGAVDYANGLCSLATDYFGTGGLTMAVAYQRAVTAGTVGESIGLPVTNATRRNTWAFNLRPLPAKGSLQIAYRSGGRWYVLNEDGSGAIRGSDSAFGAGTLNYTTGTVSVTLGALPDAPSAIIVTHASQAAVPAAPPELIPVSGSAIAVLEFDVGKAITPGSLSITWNDGSARTVTDDGTPGASYGTLTGYGVGTVQYGSGKISLAPTALPAPSTSFTIAINGSVITTNAIHAFTDSGSHWSGSFGHAIVAGTLAVSVFAHIPVRGPTGADTDVEQLVGLGDDGLGHVTYQGNVVGTIDYTTGALTVNKTQAGVTSQQAVYVWVQPLGSGEGYTKFAGTEDRTVTITFQNGSTLNPSADSASGHYSGVSGSADTSTVVGNIIALYASVDGGELAPGVTFTLGGRNYFGQSDGTLVYGVNASSGAGTPAGTWLPSTGRVAITSWVTGSSCAATAWSAGKVPAVTSSTSPLVTDGVTFRTAAAPVANSGFEVRGAFVDGTTFTVTADENGKILDTHVFGTIDYDTGIVRLRFGSTTTDPVSAPTATVGGFTGAVTAAPVVDLTDMGLTGVAHVKLDHHVLQDSLLYNAVTFDYLPLDASILGLDPVRLPSDGRVPVFRKGGVAVVHHTARTSPATHANGDVVDLGETRLAHVRVIDAGGATITAGYTVNLTTGHVTCTDVSGWSQPVVFEHRIEDMALLTDVQIGGQLKLSRPLTHNYPLGSYVSSAMLIGDMAARTSLLFVQPTWTSVWSDSPIGTPPAAHFDDVNHPVEVTNDSAITERWALIFTSTTGFNIVGEHLGVIGTGSTGLDCKPLNPHTGDPYFTLRAPGFGTGWAIGDVIRINTVGALAPVWVARVVQQGDNTLADDSATLLVRGDVNA